MNKPGRWSWSALVLVSGVAGCGSTTVADERIGSSQAALGSAWAPLPTATDGTVPSEISGSIGIGLNRSILVQDEDPRFLYDFDSANNVIKRVPFATKGADELNDLEALSQDPHTGMYFMMTSHSARKDCRPATAKRQRLGRFRLETDSAGDLHVTDFKYRGTETDSLRPYFLSMLPANVRAAATINNPKEGGLDIETFTFVPAEATPFDHDAYFIGLRGPLTSSPAPDTDTCVNGRDFGDGDAFYFYLLNANEYIDGAAPILAGPYTIDLRKTPGARGRGFRDTTLIRTQAIKPSKLGKDPRKDKKGKKSDWRLVISAGEVGFGGNPDLYLFDPANPTDGLLALDLPPDSPRGIQGVTPLDVNGVAHLALFRETGATVASEAAIIPMP